MALVRHCHGLIEFGVLLIRYGQEPGGLALQRELLHLHIVQDSTGALEFVAGSRFCLHKDIVLEVEEVLECQIAVFISGPGIGIGIGINQIVIGQVGLCDRLTRIEGTVESEFCAFERLICALGDLVDRQVTQRDHTEVLGKIGAVGDRPEVEALGVVVIGKGAVLPLHLREVGVRREGIILGQFPRVIRAALIKPGGLSCLKLGVSVAADLEHVGRGTGAQHGGIQFILEGVFPALLIRSYRVL